MADVSTSLPGAPSLKWPPSLRARTGEGGFQNSKFTQIALGHGSDDVVNFNLGGLPRRSATLSTIIGAYRAGDVWGPLFLTAELSGKGAGGANPIPVGRNGYRGGFMDPSVMANKSRNMNIRTDQPEGRWGYKIIDRGHSSSTAKYYLRVPVDAADGTAHAAFVNGTEIREDDATAAQLASGLADPWAAGGRPWQYINMLGRTLLVNGTDADASLLVPSGGSLRHSPLGIADPGDPTVTSPASSGTVTAGTWYVRIRWYDEVTGTYSGPNSRTGGGTQVTVTAGDDIKVDISGLSPPSRVSHWEVQFSQTDDPSLYQTDGGFIAIGTTTHTISADPTSGTNFHFRSVASLDVYRHANPPEGASMLAQYKGRVFYADHRDSWLVWSEADNPEHFYNDPADPSSGFNTVDAEGAVDTITSPITALAASETAIFIFFRAGIVAGEGTFVLSPDSINRDAQFTPIAQNSAGAVSPNTQVVNQDVFFISAAGPAVLSGARGQAIQPAAIREQWKTRKPDDDTFADVAYDIEEQQVLFGWSQGAFSDPRLTRVMVFDVTKGQWAAPFDFDVTSLSAMRWVDDSSVEQGLRVFLGLPYGLHGVYAYLPGDGLDGSDAEADEKSSTSATTTSVTVSGAGWTANAYRGVGVALVDRDTGRSYYRLISGNTTDTVSFEDAVPSPATGWYLYLGGCPREVHVAIPTADLSQADRMLITVRDVPGSYE